MKNQIAKLNISEKIVSLLLAGSLLTLTGCGVSETKTADNTDTTTIEEPNEEKNFIENEYDKVKGDNAVEAAITIMIDGAEDLANSAHEATQTEEFEAQKETVKENFDTLFNFLFKGEQINGYTIHDVSDSTIATAKKALHKIDEVIESYFPDYKDEVREKLQSVGEKLWDATTTIGAGLKNKVSQWLDEVDKKSDEENTQKQR